MLAERVGVTKTLPPQLSVSPCELEVRHSTGQPVLIDCMVRHGEGRRHLRFLCSGVACPGTSTSNAISDLLGDHALSRIFPFYGYPCEMVPLDRWNSPRAFTDCRHVFYRLGGVLSCDHHNGIALSDSRTTTTDRFSNFFRRM